MTISFPMSFPTGFSYKSWTMAGTCVVARNISPQSLKEQLYQHSGERWRVAFSYAPLKPEYARKLMAFLMALRGGTGTFQWGDTVLSTPSGNAGGTPVVNGASQTGTALATTGWAPSITGIMKAGDFFQVGNSYFLVLQDVNSDGSGQATLDIFPRIRTSPSNGASIITTNPKMLLRLEEPEQGWSGSIEGVYDMGFSAVEAT